MYYIHVHVHVHVHMCENVSEGILSSCFFNNYWLGVLTYMYIHVRTYMYIRTYMYLEWCKPIFYITYM